MNTGISANNPTIVSAFHSALVHQGLVVLAILAAASATWNILRSRQLRRVRSGDAPASGPSPVLREPPGRRFLRISFGLIWIFDGILQGQASMPLGMVPQGIQPTASASPSWVQHVVNAGTTIWDYHPVSAAAAAVWIQIGIGAWLLVAPRGNWSRLGGVASVAWGLVVWVFGEAFGGIFAPGLSWLFGAPGAVIFYCAAGVLIAFPESYWSSPRVGRVLLRVMGVFFVCSSLLQAWPGRGFWQGETGTSVGTLTTMAQQMSQTPQPHLLSSFVSAFASFDAAHGWAVNLFVVIALASIGLLFSTAQTKLVRIGVIAAVVLCLADWVLVQDFGFLGGIGTDPNSMIPMALVFVGGYIAMTRPGDAYGDRIVPIRVPSRLDRWQERMLQNPGYALRFLAAVSALGIVLVGALPMAAAATNPNADPLLIESIDGSPGIVDSPAPQFHLVDQYGQTVSLTSLRGKVIALTFLDDVCTSQCPIIAQEFRALNGILGASSKNLELVAINSNPRFVAPMYLTAFDRQEDLQGVHNWLFLTGSLKELEEVWGSYGIEVDYLPAGSMIGHSLYASVIDSGGHLRYLLSADPGPGTPATQSSFTVTLADAINNVLGSR